MQGFSVDSSDNTHSVSNGEMIFWNNDNLSKVPYKTIYFEFIYKNFNLH